MSLYLHSTGLKLSRRHLKLPTASEFQHGGGIYFCILPIDFQKSTFFNEHETRTRYKPRRLLIERVSAFICSELYEMYHNSTELAFGIE